MIYCGKVFVIDNAYLRGVRCTLAFWCDTICSVSGIFMIYFLMVSGNVDNETLCIPSSKMMYVVSRKINETWMHIPFFASTFEHCALFKNMEWIFTLFVTGVTPWGVTSVTVSDHFFWSEHRVNRTRFHSLRSEFSLYWNENRVKFTPQRVKKLVTRFFFLESGLLVCALDS